MLLMHSGIFVSSVSDVFTCSCCALVATLEPPWHTSGLVGLSKDITTERIVGIISQ